MGGPQIEYRQLRASQRREYLAQLATSHDIRVRCYVLDPDRRLHTHDISNILLGGTVSVNRDETPDRTATIDVLDVDGRFDATDHGSPALGGLWAGSEIQLWYDVYVTSLQKWVTCPVFTGPVKDFSTDGTVVTVNAEGKEAYLLAPNRYPNAFSKIKTTQEYQHKIAHADGAAADTNISVTGFTPATGMIIIRVTDLTKKKELDDWDTSTGSNIQIHHNTTNHKLQIVYGIPFEAWHGTRRGVLESLLTHVGEPLKLRWQGTTDNLPRGFDGLKIWKDASQGYYPLVSAIVGSHHMFYYDGAGVPHVRHRNTPPHVHIEDYILGEPTVQFDASAVRNFAQARVGHKPVKVVTEIVKTGNPFSPRNMGRGGIRRFIVEGVDNTIHYKSLGRARSALRARLVHSTTENLTVDTIPLPFLNPHDRVVIRDKKHNIHFASNQWSLPLGADETMSLGYNRRMLNKKATVERIRVLKGKRHGKKKRRGHHRG